MNMFSEANYWHSMSYTQYFVLVFFE